MMIEIFVMSLIGFVIGSFLNVCIYRIPEGKSINYPASHCAVCKHPLGAKDLIPIISYLSLGGKCRYCKTQVSKQYILIESLNGIAYGVTVFRFGLNIRGIMICTFVSLMIVLTLIDWRTMLLPTCIIQVGAGIAIGLRGVVSLKEGDLGFLMQGIIGGIVGYGILALLFFICLKVFKKEGMGYGDVRYLGMIGCFTSWQIVFLSLFLASIAGSVYGVIQLSVRKQSEPFPFGPFLSIGALIGVFYGESLMRWYVGLL